MRLGCDTRSILGQIEPKPGYGLSDQQRSLLVFQLLLDKSRKGMSKGVNLFITVVLFALLTKDNILQNSPQSSSDKLRYFCITSKIILRPFLSNCTSCFENMTSMSLNAFLKKGLFTVHDQLTQIKDCDNISVRQICLGIKILQL